MVRLAAALLIMTSYSFADINFQLKPEEIDKICDAEKASLMKQIAAVEAVTPAQATWENTVLALEHSTTFFSKNLTPVMFLKYVSSDEAVRESADKCETSVQQMFVELFAREPLYKAVKSYADKGETLAKEEAQLLEEYLTSFKRNGLALSQENRQLYVDKKKKLVEIESEFNNNIVKSNSEFLEFSKAELEGLPESFVESLEKTAESKYKVTLAYPHYYPMMENAKREDVRKRMQHKFDNRGGATNTKLLEDAINLRDDLAKLLGYANHSAFVLERRMAKKSDQVVSFLNDLAVKLKPKGQADIAELLELKRKDDPKATSINAWEWRYYENILKVTKHQINSQLIKEYFPLGVVLKGMFEVYQTILGVDYVVDKKAPKWHPDVTAYSVMRNGKPVARFYMDLFPREGKYGHAAAFTLVSGFRHENGDYEGPISSIVANFNPPTPGAPSLLQHSEVETMFHEFGHIMHQVLTQAKYATFSGTSVKTDFVEAPSQMLENWVWHKDTLKKLSGHYKNPSQPLPDDLIEKMVAAKLATVGIKYLRQVAFATIDLDYHLNRNVNTTETYAKRMSEIMLIPIQDGTVPQAAFGHLMGGYDSGYYGYLWSEVYAQDLFTRFENEGLLNPKVGSDYLNWILEPGGQQDPMDLLRGFLGREPNSDAFLRSIGL